MAITTTGIAYNQEVMSPKIEVGKYFAFQIKVAKQAQGKLIKSNKYGGGVAVTNLKKINLTGELNDISNKFKFALTAKLKPDWNKIKTAIQNRSFKDFVFGFLPTLEATAGGKQAIKFPGGQLTYQFGLDFGYLPILFRGFYDVYERGKFKSRLIVTVNMGPSLQGWLNILHRVGEKALNNFLVGNNYMVFRNVITTLATNGIITLAGTTLAVSFGLFSLMALYAAYRAEQGTLIGLSATYVSAYYRKITLAGVIDGTRKSAEDLKKDYIDGKIKTLRDKIVDAAITDALSDARKYVRSARMNKVNINDDLVVLTIWSQALKKKHHASSEYAFQKALDKSLTRRAMAILKR